jgi:hypothetical protein
MSEYAIFRDITPWQDVISTGLTPHVIITTWNRPATSDQSTDSYNIYRAITDIDSYVVPSTFYQIGTNINIQKGRYVDNLTDYYDTNSGELTAQIPVENVFNDKDLLDQVYATRRTIWYALETINSLSPPGSSFITLLSGLQESENISFPVRTVNLRNYQRIFTGTNQEYGYEKPFLSFTGSTTELTFEKDKSTYFHYPRESALISVSASKLIENGAIPGTAPYRADRIWKKQADYENNIWWGNSTPAENENGTWLCAWLSGNPNNPNQKPVWMDRYYLPGYLNDAFVYVSNTPEVWDTPSSLTFESGVWYRYDHIGEDTNTAIVNYLTTDGGMKLHLDNWDEITPDESGNSNVAFIENYNAAMIQPYSVSLERPQDTSLKLNGNYQSSFVRYSTGIALLSSMSFSFWARANDWNNVQGNHFISKNLRGGWCVKYNNGFFTPTMHVYDLSGQVHTYSTDGGLVLVKEYPGNSQIQSIAIDSEFYTWVLDNGIYDSYKHAYKVDYNGDVIAQIEFPTSINLSGMYVDISDNVYVYSSLGTLSAYNTFGTSLSSYSNISKQANALMGLDGTVCIDNNGFLWEIRDGNIYRDEYTLITSIPDALKIDCDSNNNIWILHGERSYSKYNRSGELIITGEIGSAITYGERAIHFTNEYYNGSNKDFVWFYQEVDRAIYKHDTDGNFVFRLDTTQFDMAPRGVGDCTGFKWHRLNNFDINRETPQIEAELYVYDGTQEKLRETNPPLKYTFSTDSSALANQDWHMFSFTFEYAPTSDTGEMKFYLDSTLRETISNIPSGHIIYYEYENPLYIGANVGKIKSLGEEIKSSQLFFNGSIDDVRIYDCVLDISDLRHIYFERYGFRDMKWNMFTPEHDYIEEIVRFFKHKMPGIKSQFYNIRLTGSKITDPNTRTIIEDIIRDVISKTAPMHTDLFNIIWD